jgi:hypothetical protein
MVVEHEVYLPGEDEPVDLVDYADLMLLAYGINRSIQNLPDEFHYNDPKAGYSCSAVPRP